MSIFGAFVGVSRHVSPRISEVNGAKRDALALWALFSDSMPELDACRLLDEEATVGSVRHALDQTLGTAGPEDTAILSFSGHGTHEHQLVLHDTDPSALADTTIPMTELADRFRKCPAKVVLCILDCCFSGHAPAKVLAEGPVPRDALWSLQTAAGKGRILISAANDRQPAYEQPSTGHGLLTKAIIDIFRTTEPSVNVLAAMGQIIERVRAEAAKLGLKQTPVLFGSIEGGLFLPALKAGQHFQQLFPEKRSVQVGPAIAELAALGLPEVILQEWSERFRDGLNMLQLKAVNDYGVLEGESLLVVAPTSAGKTFVGELAGIQAVLEGRKAVFLLPYRALVSEKYEQFAALYGQALDMRVIRCTGDYTDQTPMLVRGKYDIALFTYEMFLNLTLGNPQILRQIGLAVLDEAQFIADSSRGITVELLLTHLLSQRRSGIAPQVIGLSATIGNVNGFNEWIGCELLVTGERPVPLVEGVLDRSGTFHCWGGGETVDTPQLLSRHEVVMRRDKPSAQDVIVPLVRKLVAQGEKVIIFRNQRGAAQGCAAYLAKELGLPPAAEALEQLPDYDLPTTSADLRACLNGGTAFHSTDLTREEKAIVEQAFRDPEGRVRVLVATTTVAAGVNTPASTVVLAEHEFLGEHRRPFTVAEYKNMAGRAGRLGFEDAGRAVILADTPHERELLFRRYVLAKPEALRSSFESTDINTWVIRLLAQVARVRRADVPLLLANTYGGYLAARSDPSWRERMEAEVAGLLERMLTLGLLEQEGDEVQLTLLGCACGESSLCFESALRLVELVQSLDRETLTAEKLLAAIQALPEMDGCYTPMQKRGRAEAVREQEMVARFGTDLLPVLRNRARDFVTYYARCKRAAILWDWISGVPVQEIEGRYSTNPYWNRVRHGDVRQFADRTRFHLLTAQRIVSLAVPIEGMDEAVDKLLKQLEVGIPAEALDLLALPVSLSRGEYLALYNGGIKTAEHVWSAPADVLVTVLGSRSAEQLERRRPQ